MSEPETEPTEPTEPQPQPTEPQPQPEPEPTEPEAPTDQEQGVGVAPTEPGDAGEGNPGTHFQTTEEIEGAGQGDDEVKPENV